jgi:hypothetical protein
MAELFDSIVHEMMFDDVSWSDISNDVLISPEPMWNRGIMRNGPNDRIANTGRMTLFLDNSANNSGNQLGYYSPGNANVRTGFNTGIRYRLTFTKESMPWVKFHGRIQPKGIIPIPGRYGPRRTKVVIEDFMGQAVSHALELLTFTTNKTMDEVMELIVANLKIAPLSTSYATGISTFGTVFDTTRQRTRAVGEFSKLAMSEQSFVYVTGNTTDGETLVSESRQSRTGSSNLDLIVSKNEAGFLLQENGDKILQENGDGILLDQTQTASFDNVMLPSSVIGWGNHIYNQIKGISFPREVGVSNEVLFTLNTVVSIPSGETTEATRVTYRDPGGSDARVNGKNMVTPVATTDYTANTEEGGGGSDITSDLVVSVTYGTDSAQYTLTNNNAATMYVTKLQFRGIKILLFDPTISIQEDVTSQNTHGLIPLDVKMPYLNDPTIAENFTAGVLARQKDPHLSGDKIMLNTARNSMTMYGFLQLAEPGQRGEFIETVSGMDGDWFVNGYTAKIIAGKYVEYGLVLSDASQYDYWVLEVSLLQNNTLLNYPADI